MNKVLIKLYVPFLEESFDIWIPITKKIYNVIELLVKAISELSEGSYKPTKMPLLYDRNTAKELDINETIKEAKIKNGTELILI